ncbi:hypothetical protein D3C72_2516970 [compost metagenome]
MVLRLSEHHALGGHNLRRRRVTGRLGKFDGCNQRLTMVPHNLTTGNLLGRI